ncbi:hypothetical protein BH10ACT11_BH10ACT11_08450 [soil metagenome]
MGALIEIPQGWARWELEPIDSSGRHTTDERLMSGGNFASQFMTNKVLQRKPGSRIRKRLMTAAVRGGFGLTNRREYEALFQGTYAERCQLSFEAFFPDMAAGEWRGRDELLEYMLSFDDAYASMHFQPLEIIDAGGNLVGAAIEVSAAGRSTGIELTRVFGIVYEFEAGRVYRQDVLEDWPKAIETMKVRAGVGSA